MSDAMDDLEFWERQLLRGSQVNPLRTAMREFITETQPSTDIKALREQISDGTALSELVDKNREERL